MSIPECDSCGEQLVPIFKELPVVSVNGETVESEYSNLDGCLQLTLHGSYGEYYDFMGQPRTINLCKNCGDKLNIFITQDLHIEPYELELTHTLTELIAKAADKGS